MCGIMGLLSTNVVEGVNLNGDLRHTLWRIAKRGPDCFGLMVWGRRFKDEPFTLLQTIKVNEKIQQTINQVSMPEGRWADLVCLVNFRGIPTTEDFGQDEQTIQPFHPVEGGVTVVHNGLLSNDQVMYDKHGWSNLTSKRQDIDSYVFCHIFDQHLTREPLQLLREVEGSYALAAFDPKRERLWLARNFRGLFVNRSLHDRYTYTTWFASEAGALSHLSDTTSPFELPLDSLLIYDLSKSGVGEKSDHRPRADTPPLQLKQFAHALKLPPENSSAVVVLSAGMDSTVCATLAAQEYKRVHMMHFQYGCRAEKQEEQSFLQIVGWLRAKNPDCTITHSVEDLGFIKRLGGSTLTDHSLEVAKGEKGVETDNEWVPHRNGVMIALAAAYCDRHNFRDIILGLNMEEGSVFSDNSIEYYERMEAALAIGAKSGPKMVMPLGNLMKRHILKLGVDIEAPLHLSWSCYHGSSHRCGGCGPCIMRIQAYRANGLRDDPTLYVEGANV